MLATQPIQVRNRKLRGRVLVLFVATLCLSISGWSQITFNDPPASDTLFCNYVPDMPTITANSPCSSGAEVEPAESRSDGSCEHNYTLTRTWTATDGCGNEAVHEQILYVVDEQAPILAGVPANRTVRPDDLPPEPNPIAIDFCDSNPTLALQRDSLAGPCGGYTITYRYTASDACNNAISAVYVLTVSDDELPVVEGVTPGTRLQCGDTLPAPPTNVRATDNGNTPTLTMHVDTLDQLGGDTCMVVRRVWTATDDCGNTATAAQAFSFHDNNAPTLSGIPADTVIYCEALPPPPELYTDITAGDNCDVYPGLIYEEISGQTSNGTCTDVTYTVTRRWTAVDECGNETTAEQLLEIKCECCFNGIDDDDDGLVDDYDPQCNCFAGAAAECDSTKMYYIPPVWQPNRNLYNQPSELVVTTLADVANIQVQTADGTTFNQTYVVEKGTPLVIPLTINQLQTPNHDAVERDRGWVITSDRLIQPIYRIDAFFNKVLVTVKGPQAVGRVFRAGSQTSNCGTNDMFYREGHFISVMATEDNTEVTFDYSFPALNGLAGPVTRTLNRFETYLIRDDDQNTTVSGSLITATKPIVVTSGSQHTKACEYIDGSLTGRVARGMDGGIDQLVPNCLTGDEYVLVRGKGSAQQQYAILVANKNNTRVVMNGDAANEMVLNAGDHTQIYLDGTEYQPFHFKATKPFYMYHVSGISGNNEVGMAICAPVGECKGDTLIEFPKFAAANATQPVDNSVYTIMSTSGLSTLSINGTPYSDCASAVPVPSRPDLSVVTFENDCLEDYNVVTADSYFTAGMLVGIDGETGTHGYLTAFKDRMSVFDPRNGRVTTGYFIDTLCGNQTIEHCLDVASCATEHSIAAVRQGAGTVTLAGGTCLYYTSPDDFQGEDEILVTLTNDQGLFQTVCLRVYICAQPPEANFPFLDTLVNCDQVPPLEVPTFEDDCDVDIEFVTEEVIDAGTCDYAYIIYRNWTIWDDCGDSTLATQTIRVQDTSAPQAINIPSDTLYAACEGVPPVPTISFEENCDSDYEWSFTQRTEDSTCVYDKTIVREWRAWDRCGNTSTAIQRIELRDTAGPILNGVPNDEIASCSGSWSLPYVTAVDDCDPNPSLTLDSTVYSSICDTLYHVVRRWTATDACGRTTVATQRFLVMDLESPIVIDVPRDTMIACGEPMPTDVPTFVDECTDPVPVFTVDSVVTGTCPIVSTYYRTWTAVDDCGHTTEVRQRIDVVDTIGPSFIPLPDTVFSSCLDSVVVIEPTVLEACNLELTYTDSMAAGSNCTTERLLYRTYRAVDNCDREAIYQQLYYFQDTVPPFWISEPSDVVLQCEDPIPTPISIDVADACSGINPIDMVERDSQRVCPARRWIFREYLVSDWCGNLSRFTHTIIIDGCEPAVPVLATAEATCAGATVTLRASVDSGYTTPVYRWEYSADSIAWSNLSQPSDSTTLTISAASAAENGYYRVVVANNEADLDVEDCSSTSEALPVTFYELERSDQYIDLCRGDTLYYLGDTLTESTIRTDTLLTVNGCDSIANLELNVYPFVDTQLDTVLCFGESLNLYGSTYSTSGTYRDTLYTTYGCDTTVELTLTVLPNYLDTTYAFLCGSETVDFEGETYDSPGIYTANLQSSSGCDSSRTLVLDTGTPRQTSIDTVLCPGAILEAAGETFSDAGTYSRVLQNIEGCDSTINIRIRRTGALDEVLDVSLCQGEPYFFGDQVIRTAGRYTRSLSSTYGCDSTITVVVEMSPTHDVEIRAERCEGEIYTNQGYSFSAPGRWEMNFHTANGCDSNVYVTLIYRPEQDVDLVVILCEGDSYQLFDTLLTTTGTYQRVGATMFGCDSTVTLRLTAKPLATTRIDTTLCFGESLEVAYETYTQTTVDTLELTDYAGCDSLVFVDVTVLENPSWDTTALICEGEFFATGGRSYAETGIYRDTAQSVTGCDSITTVILTVAPVFRETIEQSICAGDTLTIAGQQLFTAGQHDLTLINRFGCDSTVTVDLEVRDTAYTELELQLCEGTQYEADGQVFTTSGTYELNLRTFDNCDSTVQLTLAFVPPSRTSAEVEVCDGEVFSFGPHQIDTPGHYSDTLTSILGCDSIHTLLVSYRPAQISEQRIEICDGDSTLLAGAYRTLAGVYRDTVLGRFGCDSTLETTLIVHGNTEREEYVELCFGQSHTFGDQRIDTSGVYEQTFTSARGCDSSVTLTVHVEQPILLAADDVRACAGQKVRLQARGYDGPVRWSPSRGLDCIDCLDPEVRVDATTTFTVWAVDCHGDTISATSTVRIDPPVNVSIVSEGLVRLGDYTTLLAVVDNATARLTWREGQDILCEGCSEIEVQPMATTDYEVEARTPEGCEDRARLTLLVEDDCHVGKVEIPNVLTPNGDGINDEFEIRYEGVADVSLLRIYGRWGELIYETENVDDFWDGTHHGNPVNPGVFVYYLSGYCLGGQEFTEQGNVTVVR